MGGDGEPGWDRPPPDLSGVWPVRSTDATERRLLDLGHHVLPVSAYARAESERCPDRTPGKVPSQVWSRSRGSVRLGHSSGVGAGTGGWGYVPLYLGPLSGSNLRSRPRDR